MKLLKVVAAVAVLAGAVAEVRRLAARVDALAAAVGSLERRVESFRPVVLPMPVPDPDAADTAPMPRITGPGGPAGRRPLGWPGRRDGGAG